MIIRFLLSGRLTFLSLNVIHTHCFRETWVIELSFHAGHEFALTYLQLLHIS